MQDTSEQIISKHPLLQWLCTVLVKIDTVLSSTDGNVKR